MDDYNSLAHTKWNCKSHVVFIPKYRRNVLYGSLRRYLGSVFHDQAQQKERSIEQGALCPDHVHMLIWIPPTLSVSSVVGYVKGKSAIYVARHVRGKSRNYTGQALWARGFFVSTVGIDEETIREYIRHQEEEDQRFDPLDFFRSESSPDEPKNDGRRHS
jgi:putative transposase